MSSRHPSAPTATTAHSPAIGAGSCPSRWRGVPDGQALGLPVPPGHQRQPPVDGHHLGLAAQQILQLSLRVLPGSWCRPISPAPNNATFIWFSSLLWCAAPGPAGCGDAERGAAPWPARPCIGPRAPPDPRRPRGGTPHSYPCVILHQHHKCQQEGQPQHCRDKLSTHSPTPPAARWPLSSSSASSAATAMSRRIPLMYCSAAPPHRATPASPAPISLDSLSSWPLWWASSISTAARSAAACLPVRARADDRPLDAADGPGGPVSQVLVQRLPYPLLRAALPT